jgi:hypothetical protein
MELYTRPLREEEQDEVRHVRTDRFPIIKIVFPRRSSRGTPMLFNLYDDEAPNYLRSPVRDTRMHTPEKIAAPVHFSSHTQAFALELLNTQDPFNP